jgi:hypothetical protein
MRGLEGKIPFQIPSNPSLPLRKNIKKCLLNHPHPIPSTPPPSKHSLTLGYARESC